jgi:hypothetical protein
VNQLTVTPVMKNGQSLTMVTADGTCVVPPEVAEASSEVMVQAIPAVRVTVPAKGTLRVSPIGAAPLPVNPTVMEAQPAVRTLPSALPARKTNSGVSQGQVTFEDEPEAKPMK